MTKDEIQRLLKLDKELMLFVQRMRKVVETIDEKETAIYNRLYNRLLDIYVALDKVMNCMFFLAITAGGISLVALGVSLYNLVGR